MSFRGDLGEQGGIGSASNNDIYISVVALLCLFERLG